MKQGQETTFEERIQIVRECIASDKNYGELALKYQDSYQQVRKWTLRFAPGVSLCLGFRETEPQGSGE